MTVRAIGINHVALEVDDLDAALEWYGRFFGFELHGRSESMAFLDLGDQFLALAARAHDPADGPTAAPRDRGRHVGLVVADKDALRAELAAAGHDVSPPPGRPPGSLRVFDPGGNHLEIVDYRDVQFSKADSVLAGMGLAGLEKSAGALAELRDNGLAPG